MSREKNWYVITGGPSSGKTTTVNYLSFLGYRGIPEIARILINVEMSKGKSLDEVGVDTGPFQDRVVDMKIALEKRLPEDEIVFFDRAIPDNIAYNRMYGGDLDRAVEASKNMRYAKVFFMEQLPFEKDYARFEDKDQAKKTSRMLLKAYREMNYDVVKVPVMPADDRVDYILDRINKKK